MYMMYFVHIPSTINLLSSLLPSFLFLTGPFLLFKLLLLLLILFLLIFLLVCVWQRESWCISSGLLTVHGWRWWQMCGWLTGGYSNEENEMSLSSLAMIKCIEILRQVWWCLTTKPSCAQIFCVSCSCHELSKPTIPCLGGRVPQHSTPSFSSQRISVFTSIIFPQPWRVFCRWAIEGWPVSSHISSVLGAVMNLSICTLYSVLVLVAKHNISDQSQAGAVVCGHKHNYLEDSLIGVLFPFSKITMVVSLLEPMISLAMHFWPAL